MVERVLYSQHINGEKVNFSFTCEDTRDDDCTKLLHK